MEHKKKDTIIVNLARDLLSSTEGDNCPTIAHYIDTFGVSRGTVQDAYAMLEKSGSLKVRIHGKNGRTIQQLDRERLKELAQLDEIFGSMPLPVNEAFTSLSTAFFTCMADYPTTFSLAFLTGGGNRIKALRQHKFDFVVVSEMCGRDAVETYDDIELALKLNGCFYSYEYALCLRNTEAQGIEDGMRVAIDYTCLDQAKILLDLTKDKAVTFVPTSYVSICPALMDGTVDVALNRIEPWMEELPIKVIPISDILSSYHMTMVPVILTNKNNYRFGRFLADMIDVDRYASIQNDVREQRLHVRFF